MVVKLHDAELRVMSVIWKNGEITASRIAEELKEKFDYSKTTTYTLIKRCLTKGAIKRTDPGFYCSALVTREQAQELELSELVDKLYDGATDMLVASILADKKLSPEEAERLRRFVNEWSELN